MQNELSKALSAADTKVQYDVQCRRVLSQKEVLAWILKNTAEEFKDLSLEEIEGCIEGTPEVSTVGVNPGETNEMITGMPNEDRVKGEGSVTYDVRFFAGVPKSGKLIRLIINLEAQKSWYPGYKIPTRGVFYGARMISAQLGTEFKDSDYDGIRKVYSIWLCFGVPDYIGNAIAEYRLEKRDILPGFPDDRDAYDKLSVVVVGLKESDFYPNEFMGMINTLLSPAIPVTEKKRILTEKYSMRMESGLSREVDLMCNLSGYVEERGVEKGRKEGIQQGENALGKLVNILLSKGELENIQLVTTDKVARKDFYRKYGIIEDEL